MTRLAVVVVNHNAGSFLPACLSSIYAAAGDLALDVVLVDNASVDGSTERVGHLHPSLRVVKNRLNRGFAAAANQGIRATTASFVFLLNPDAEITGGSLASLVKVAADRPRAGILGPLVRNSDGSIQASARKVPDLLESLGHAFLGPFAPNNRFSRSYTMAEWDRSSEREVEWVSGCAMLVRRDAFEAVMGFDEGYFMYVEDVDICTRLRQAGWSVLFSPELEVVHETGVSARKRSRRLAFEHSRSIYRYFAKHRARGPAVFLKPLVKLAVWLRALLVTRGSRARASARGTNRRALGPRGRPSG
jgi:N-acetylglucosaminyl-diphospho-decaprenol L-rhamnosyltransferase